MKYQLSTTQDDANNKVGTPTPRNTNKKVQMTNNVSSRNHQLTYTTCTTSQRRHLSTIYTNHSLVYKLSTTTCKVNRESEVNKHTSRTSSSHQPV